MHDDPNGGSYGYGGDYLAPVVSPPNNNLELWSAKFRNAETERYINDIEAVTREAVVAVASPIRGYDCYLDAPDDLLDGSGSAGFGLARDIQKYEWFENGELIAVGATPSLFFGEGQHDVTLRVTAGCNGLDDEDEVAFFLASDCPSK